MNPTKMKTACGIDGRSCAKYVGRDVICETGWRGVRRQIGMSPREFEITQRLFDDMNESEIAGELGISHHTVHTHLERLYRKASVSSRVQLVVQVMSQYVSLCITPRCDEPSHTCSFSIPVDTL